MRENIKHLKLWLLQKASRRDAFFLSFLTVAIAWCPYYLHQTVNLFELGLYLPGISAILDGRIPYKDFFHLRGPFELYLPALLMRLFGEHTAVLLTCFYAGNLLTLILCVWIARALYPYRLFLYILVPVLVTKTFPRVVFTYWGGMRYAWGMMAVLCAVQFFQSQRRRWLVGAGLLTTVGGLTSIEIGACAFVAIIAALAWNPTCRRGLIPYGTGILILLGPYLGYLAGQGALNDYFHAHEIVLTRMTKTFLLSEAVPVNVPQFFHALFIPADKNFRHMTPVFCYAAYGFYLWWRHRRGQLNHTDRAATVVAVYGLMIYATGFRNLWASVFEMSLQPEKIILFYLLARGVEILLTRQVIPKFSYFLVILLVASSWGYSIDRFYKRYFPSWRKAFQRQELTSVDLPQLKGLKVPQGQAQDFVQLDRFLTAHTSPGEAVWMYPELGTLHFVLNRPWVGKFPVAALAWMDEDWHADYMTDLARTNPRYAIVNTTMPQHFPKTHFPVAANLQKFEAQMAYLKQHYTLVDSSPTFSIYKRHD